MILQLLLPPSFELTRYATLLPLLEVLTLRLAFPDAPIGLDIDHSVDKALGESPLLKELRRLWPTFSLEQEVNGLLLKSLDSCPLFRCQFALTLLLHADWLFDHLSEDEDLDNDGLPEEEVINLQFEERQFAEVLGVLLDNLATLVVDLAESLLEMAEHVRDQFHE